MEAVQWSTDVGQADWVGPRLSSSAGARVDSTVPGGFAAYARVLHPASYGDDETPIRWDEVAAGAGLTLREGGCFPEIALLPPGHDAPAPGLLGPADMLGRAGAEALVEVLGDHTADPDDCWFCLWDGYGWESPTHEETPAVPQAVLDGPRVGLPDRDYLLYRGAVGAALAFVDDEQQMPNLWWPADRSWCVATELYAEWSCVAGSHELVGTLVGDPRLEAHRVGPTDTPVLAMPAWLTEQVEVAVSRVLAGETGVVSTSQGSVTSTWTGPDLETRTARPDGTVMSSSIDHVARRRPDDVRYDITNAVLDLLR